MWARGRDPPSGPGRRRLHRDISSRRSMSPMRRRIPSTTPEGFMKRLRRALSSIGAMVLGIIVFVAIGEAHDLFLLPRDFVVSPGATVDVRVLNGTFVKSEGAVTRN